MPANTVKIAALVLAILGAVMTFAAKANDASTSLQGLALIGLGTVIAILGLGMPSAPRKAKPAPGPPN